MSKTQATVFSFPESKRGSFLLIPLKHRHSAKEINEIGFPGEKCLVESEDISESVKQTINVPDTLHSVTRYKLSEKEMVEIATGFSIEEKAPLPLLYALEPGQEGTPEDCCFRLCDSELYVFGIGVAFLVLGFTYPNATILRRICNLGFTTSDTVYRYRSDNQICDFDLNQRFRCFCESLGLIPFSKEGTPLFVESHVFNIGVVRNRFKTLDEIRAGSKTLHLQEDLDRHVTDDSEEDVFYTYSVKAQELDSHRFGYCITSQTVSYFVANSKLDIDYEMRDQLKDAVPMVLLALYQKYTCLHFRELLSILPPNSRDALQKLKLAMMEFQAYGTFPAAGMSRWHNTKQIYKYILDTNGIPEAVATQSLSLKILDEREKEFEEKEEKERDRRSNLVLFLLSLFGVLSIPETVVSLLKNILHGSWKEVTVIISLLFLLSITILILLFRKKKK